MAVTNVDITGAWYGSILVARAWINCTIKSSYSTGSVKGIIFVGGLVGISWRLTISNSYSSASVTGKDYAGGGLVGHAECCLTIDNCYCTGSVTGEEWIGG